MARAFCYFVITQCHFCVVLLFFWARCATLYICLPIFGLAGEKICRYRNSQARIRPVHYKSKIFNPAPYERFIGRAWHVLKTKYTTPSWFLDVPAVCFQRLWIRPNHFLKNRPISIEQFYCAVISIIKVLLKEYCIHIYAIIVKNAMFFLPSFFRFFFFFQTL